MEPPELRSVNGRNARLVVLLVLVVYLTVFGGLGDEPAAGASPQRHLVHESEPVMEMIGTNVTRVALFRVRYKDEVEKFIAPQKRL